MKKYIFMYQMATPTAANVRAHKEMLKVFTTIPNDFIQSYHTMMRKQTSNHSYPVDLDVGAQWLKVDRDDFIQNIKHQYKKSIDYIVTKNPNTSGPGGHNREKVFVTREAFKRICLRSSSPMGEKVRTYFIRIEELTMTYAPEFKQAILNTIGTDARAIQKTRYTDDGPGFIYALRSGKARVVRIGMTKRGSLVRLKEHNSSRAKKLELLMDIQVNRRREVERCLHLILKEKQYLGEDPAKPERGEVYQVDIHILRKLVQSCSQLTSMVRGIDLDSIDEREQLYLLFIDDDPAEVRKVDELILDWERDPNTSCLLRGVPSKCYKKPVVKPKKRVSTLLGQKARTR